MRKNEGLTDINSKYETSLQKNMEIMKKLQSENLEMKEKLKNSVESENSKNQQIDEQTTKLYEQKIKELETKLSETQNINLGLEKKINIYSKEMENRFKKLIQDSEKKEIENKDLIKKNEILINKLQENEKNLMSSANNNSKFELVMKENTELKDQNKKLAEAFGSIQGKIIELESQMQKNENGNKNENYEAVVLEYEELQEKYNNLEQVKNKLENECSQIKVY